MKKSIYAILVLMILAIFIAGCTENEVKTETKEPIKIGVIAPLTGNAAELGQHIQRGVELANLNLEGKYTLIFEDDECTNTNKALSAAYKMINIDRVKYVIGPLCAPAYQATSGVFNDNQIIFMHTSGVTPSFTESSGTYGIPGISTTIYEEDKFLSDFIYDNLGIKKMAVFVWNEEWAVEHRNGFVNNYKGEIVFEEKFLMSQSDFKTEIAKIKSSGAEGIFVVALNFQNAIIVNQFKEMGLDIPIFGQFEIEDTAFLDSTGKNAVGVMYVYPKIYDSNEETSSFVNSYKSKYESEPNYYANIGYDALKIYDWAIEKCEDDSACVIQEILSLENFAGVSGSITFDENKNIKREFVMKKITEQGIQIIE